MMQVCNTFSFLMCLTSAF